MTKPDALQFIGPKDANGQPLEWFGGATPIPARDLTAEDLAGFGAAEWALLDSPTGKRLYAHKSAVVAGRATPVHTAKE